MTPLLLSLLVLLALYGVYLAARTARLGAPPQAFADAGHRLPGWAVMFLLPGLAAAALGVERHFAMIGRFGLQASHVAAGFVLVAIAALLVWNRLWLATRVAGLSTPGEALGRFYDSVALRVVVMGITLLFALPFAGHILSSVAVLLDASTEGLVPRAAGVWLIAIALAFPAIIGGWRATVMILAMYSILLALLLPSLAVFNEVTSAGPGYPFRRIAVDEGMLWDRIPGVLQNSACVGKAMPAGGIFTAAGIVSAIVALLGIVFSPGVLYLGQTAPGGRGLGVSTVWLLAGFMAGCFVLAAPVLAARMPDGPLALAGSMFEVEPLAGAGLLLMMMVGALLAVSFFVTSGAILIMRELVLTYLFPHLGARGARLGHRIALGFAFFFVALAAGFAPLVCAIAGSVALPLSVQLLPALLGLSFLRIISRGAVLAGLAIGCLVVVFTEPLGLVLFEALFVELPWGRWPLTIHSAAWGLVFNLAFVLLSSAATLRAPDRFERDRLHDAMAAALPPKQTGGRALLWSLMLLWGFLAYGPGAILGNTFFSDPIFTERQAELGVPSLWVWQILFWLLGVVLVWWFAYRIGFGRTSSERIRPITLGEPEDRRTPDWLAAGLERVTKKAS
ncbi:hypothetical protein [Roseovarius salis]|uniref:hypothetical protein n=1 Tax=Roseovarius salis TaxID=3376063 RepID=UPI0037C54FC3